MKDLRFSQHIKGYIELIRPFTLLAPIIVSICIMFASLFYSGDNHFSSSIWWTLIIPASFSLAILNGASNALNQVTDIKADKISKPYRPIPKKIVTIQEAKVISVFMYSLAFAISLFVNFMFCFFVLLIIFFTVTYSLPPRLKDKLIFNQLWVAVPRGLLGVLASWSVFGNSFHPVPITIGFIAMFFLIGGSITKDITDCEADRKVGTHTLINTYGIKKSALLSLPFLFFPFAFVPLFIEWGLLDSYFWLLTFLAIPSYLIFHLMIRDKSKSRFLENTSAWAMMYVTYFVFASSFSLITIVSSVLA